MITWQQDGDSVNTADVVNKTVLYQSVTSTLTILVTGNGIGSTVSCITYFSEDNNPSDTTHVLNNGSSVPEYNSTKLWKLFGEKSTGMLYSILVQDVGQSYHLNLESNTFCRFSSNLFRG